MKKFLSLLTATVLVLSFSIAPVFAATETISNKTLTNGGSYYLTNIYYNKDTSGTTDYCVNLTSCSAPGLPTNLVGANNLVFRPYSSTGMVVANSVNFYNTQCSESNRKYGSWISGAQNNGYKLKGSLSGVSGSINFSLRWNP